MDVGTEIHTKDKNIFCEQKVHLFGVFANLRRATFRFVLSVCPFTRLSVRRHGTNRLPLNGLS